MKALKLTLAALAILVAGATVVAAPAMATPARTDSVGSQPTNPYFDPITSTRSQYTGVGGPFTVGVIGLGLQVQCPISRMSAYAGETHTQLRVTELSVGDAVPNSCIVMPGPWRVLDTDFTCTATSEDPWLFHITRINVADPNSVTGTLNNPTKCEIILDDRATGASCLITIDARQSMRGRYTQANGSLSVAELNITVTILGIRCPWRGSFNGQISGNWTLRPDTAADGRLRFRDVS